uniref:Uncharacterized protein MANES_18G052800 n=1 Tax=Rhizophora mucronata TaxID=61149 RepID=A0A2P2KZC0_RHIMU
MANAWRRENNRHPKLLSPKPLLLLLLCLSLLLLFLFLTSRSPSNPDRALSLSKTLTPTNTPGYPLRPFDCPKSPQAHPVIANVVENLKYPFLYSLSDFGSLPDKPHKNIVRLLKGKPFRKPDISETIQELLEGMKGQRNGLVLDVGANVGMASFAAAVMGFRVLAFEPVLENLQRICDGIWFNRVGDLVTVFEAAASDQIGNITFHKVS